MTSKRPSRRDFLTGQTFSEKIRNAADEAIAGETRDQAWPLLTFSREAMATDFEVSFNRGQYPQATAAALEALDEVERLERLLSVFRKESEISSINRNAAREPIPVDPEAWVLIWLCHRLTLETDGAIDITASPLWRLWGFAKHQKTVPTQEEIQATLQNTGDSLVQFGPDEKTVHFLKPGIELNLGCVGKGAALDTAALRLQNAGIEHFLMHGGKSSVIARGGRIGETWPALTDEQDRATGWTVGITHPMRHGQRLAEIRLCNEALGTSGSQQQFFLHQGKRYSHIIDPRTGYPAEQVLMSTVVAPTAALADALSTAFFVLPPEQTAAYCRSHHEIAALLVLADDSPPNRCRIEHFGFQPGQIRFV